MKKNIKIIILVLAAILISTMFSSASRFEISNFQKNTLNSPPYPPKLAGPSLGAVGEKLSYTVWSTDPDKDNIQYGIDWGVGASSLDESDFYPSGETIILNYTWNKPGNYYVKAFARDEYHIWGTPSQTITVTISHRPLIPTKPSGPNKTEIKSGVKYNYSTSTSDPDGDRVCYNFSWGDGKYSGWGPYIESGDTFIESHSWEDPSTLEIKVKAKDINGLESDWSESLIVDMPKKKVVTIDMSPLFQRFIALLQDRFPWFILSLS